MHEKILRIKTVKHIVFKIFKNVQNLQLISNFFQIKYFYSNYRYEDTVFCSVFLQIALKAETTDPL